MCKTFFLWVIGKLHAYSVSLQPTTSPSTLLLQGKEIPIELELMTEMCKTFQFQQIVATKPARNNRTPRFGQNDCVTISISNKTFCRIQL